MMQASFAALHSTWLVPFLWPRSSRLHQQSVPTKRKDLVARLLASPSSSTHLAQHMVQLAVARSKQSPKFSLAELVFKRGFAVALQRTYVTIAWYRICSYRPVPFRTARPHSLSPWKANPRRSPPKRLACSWVFSLIAPSATTIRSITGSRPTSGALRLIFRSFRPRRTDDESRRGSFGPRRRRCRVARYRQVVAPKPLVETDHAGLATGTQAAIDALVKPLLKILFSREPL